MAGNQAEDRVTHTGLQGVDRGLGLRLALQLKETLSLKKKKEEEEAGNGNTFFILRLISHMWHVSLIPGQPMIVRL